MKRRSFIQSIIAAALAFRAGKQALAFSPVEQPEPKIMPVTVTSSGPVALIGIAVGHINIGNYGYVKVKGGFDSDKPLVFPAGIYRYVRAIRNIRPGQIVMTDDACVESVYILGDTFDIATASFDGKL